MTKENAAYLFGGFAFGVLAGVILFNAMHTAPQLGPTLADAAAMPAPAAPMGGAQNASAAGGGGAPMAAEINRLKRQLEQEPGNIEVMTRLAHMYHDVQMWEPASEFYKQALELRPDDPDMLTDLGICYRGMQRYDDALKMFARAREADPDHWQSLFNAAVVQAFDLGDYDAALASLEPLAKLNPVPPRVTELREAVLQARDAKSGS